MMVNEIGIVIKQQYNITKKHTEDKTMIKANELRIGNLIILPNGDIGKISYHEIRLMVVAIEKPDYQPIPLTEEWLLKFGGKPLENGYWISVTNLKAELHFELFKNTDEIVTTIKSQFCDLILDRIKYVHQLQNLYFCLCGEELTIKEVNNEQ
jgi:hypothetical protein